MKKLLLTIAVFALSFSPTSALALYPVPPSINFQGKLLDETQAPKSGLMEMQFSIYDAVTAGNLIWEEVYTIADGNAIDVKDGIFNVKLGEGEYNHR